MKLSLFCVRLFSRNHYGTHLFINFEVNNELKALIMKLYTYIQFVTYLCTKTQGFHLIKYKLLSIIIDKAFI